MGCQATPADARDAWAVLGLRPGAQRDELRARYRRLAATEHPDKRPGDPRAAERFAQITAAYQELTSSPRRVVPNAGAPRPGSSVSPSRQSQNLWAEFLAPLGMTIKDVREGMQKLTAFSGMAGALYMVYYLAFGTETLQRELPWLFPPADGRPDPESLKAGLAYLESLGLEPDPEMMSPAAPYSD